MNDFLKGLKSTAIWAIHMIARILAEGFTGKIEIDCSQGGVTGVRRTETMRPPKKN